MVCSLDHEEGFLLFVENPLDEHVHVGFHLQKTGDGERFCVSISRFLDQACTLTGLLIPKAASAAHDLSERYLESVHVLNLLEHRPDVLIRRQGPGRLSDCVDHHLEFQLVVVSSVAAICRV